MGMPHLEGKVASTKQKRDKLIEDHKAAVAKTKAFRDAGVADAGKKAVMSLDIQDEIEWFEKIKKDPESWNAPLFERDAAGRPYGTTPKFHPVNLKFVDDRKRAFKFGKSSGLGKDRTFEPAGKLKDQTFSQMVPHAR